MAGPVVIINYRGGGEVSGNFLIIFYEGRVRVVWYGEFWKSMEISIQCSKKITEW